MRHFGLGSGAFALPDTGFRRRTEGERGRKNGPVLLGEVLKEERLGGSANGADGGGTCKDCLASTSIIRTRRTHGNLEYLIAVPSDGEVPEEFAVYTVPAMTWAVFPCTPETVAKTEDGDHKVAAEIKVPPVKTGAISPAG